jgi:predicted GNAT family acetyltransferase
MTAAVLDRPTFAQPELDGGGTLAELLDSALLEARTNGSTECPVCHTAAAFTRAGAREAECSGCGSRLS